MQNIIRTNTIYITDIQVFYDMWNIKKRRMNKALSDVLDE
jgi:hypothetical protein